MKIRLIDPPTSFLQSGFTLIEVMLVIVIIGLMAGMATLAIGGNEHRIFQDDVQQLRMRLNAAQDDAFFQQRTLGVKFSNSGYEFLTFQRDKRQWARSESAPLNGVNFSLPVNLELSLNGEPLILSASKTHSEEKYNVERQQPLSTDDTDTPITPDIVLLSNGEMSAFHLRLMLENNTELAHQLSSDGFSAIAHEIVNHDR